jgi:hypothetical protein
MLLSNRLTKPIGIERFIQVSGPIFLVCMVCVLDMLAASRVLGGDVLSTIGKDINTSVSSLADESWCCSELDVSALPCSDSATQLSSIYEISTRHLPDRFRSIPFDQPNVEVNKWTGNRWQCSHVDAALPTIGTGELTIIYVHGNFMERNNALERVRIVDRYLRTQTDRPYRLLMLSWPSQREKKPLRDVRLNAESAECESLYVAWMLQRLRNEPQVSLLGFSFGARAVTGGLHLDAGGFIPGYAVPPMPNRDSSLNYRLGLVAPAIDRHWIEKNGRHHLALTHVDSMINLYNSRDPILRRFRFLDRISQPIAAGFAGFAAFGGVFDPRVTSPLAGQSRIRQYDCGSVIGTTHSEKSYYGECPYFRTMIQHLLWIDSTENTCNAAVVP